MPNISEEQKSLYRSVKEVLRSCQGAWAIEKEALDNIRQQVQAFEKEPKAFLDLFSDFEPQQILSINEDEATISITGPLVDVDSCASVWMGCTSYANITQAIEEIKENDSIKRVIFEFDTPGGMVSGCDNVAIAIKNLNKPTQARAGKMVASAGYWLASQCDEIIATSATASFGSIGVVIEYWDGERRMNEAGYDKIQLTSSNAPNKRVDPKTDEGRRKVIDNLDQIESVFLRRVAEGRGKDLSYVTANFGRGDMFLAEKSLSVGMIDKNDFSIQNRIVGNKEEETLAEDQMPESLKDLLAKNPELQKEMDAHVNEKIKEATEKNEPTGEEKVENKNSLAIKVLTSEAYGKPVKELAGKVLEGTASMESLQATLTVIDSMTEEKASQETQEEAEGLSETPATTVNDSSKADAGVIHDEESYQATLKRLREIA